MRAFTTAQFGVLTAGIQSEFIRVSIKDSGGTFRDLTTYPGFNAVKNVSWAERVDDPHMTCDIVLMREQNKLSLSPMISASALNRGFNPASAFGALLAINREVKVEVAITSMDKQPSSGDWFEVFRGKVDRLDTASGDDIKVECRSLGGRLAQQFIKTELVYSFAAVAGVAVPLRIWEPQMVVVLNQTYMLPSTRGTADPGYNRFYKCSQSGTTNTVEPTWSGGTGIVDGTAKWDYVGAPTTSGNPVEQVMQNILNDHKASGDPTVTLYVPTSPSWAIRQYVQAREFVLDAVTKLAHQIGWDLRYKWRAGTSQFEFTFYAPVRSSPSVNYVFNAWDYQNPTKLSVDIANIRNAWRVVYSDRADLWPDGQPKRKVIEVNDSTSIAKYGELWAEIQEDENSQIDSSTEATTLANAALSDCKEPNAELSTVLTRGFPWVEVNDYVTFSANGLHFDTDQSLAVTGWQQSYDGKKLQTTLELRGLPTIGAATFIDVSVHPKIPVRNLPPPLVQDFVGPTTPNTLVSSEVGGGSISISSQIDKKRVADTSATEVHLYRDPGSTLNASTLKAVSPGVVSKMSVGDLVPGKTYYGKTVVRSFSKGKVLRGQPSTEFSFIAGRANSGHYDSGATPGLLPLNGNFEHFTDDPAAGPPDHWTVTDDNFGDAYTNFWGVDDGVYYGTDSTKGKFVTLKTGANDPQRGCIQSSLFPVRRGAFDLNIYLSLRKSTAAITAANASLWMRIDCYTLYGGSVVSSAYFEFPGGVGTAPWSVPTASTWYDIAFGMEPSLLPIPANINFLQVTFYRGTATSDDYDTTIEWDIGDVYLETTGQHSAKLQSLTVMGGTVLGNNVEVDGDFSFFGSIFDFSHATLTNVDPGAITQEAWHNINASGGSSPAFANSYSNFDTSSYQPTAFMKDAMGFVHLRGLIKHAAGASLNQTIFTLDTGYRPAKRVIVAIVANNKHARLEIDTSGNVTVQAADDAAWYTFFNVDGITFDTRS